MFCVMMIPLSTTLSNAPTEVKGSKAKLLIFYMYDNYVVGETWCSDGLSLGFWVQGLGHRA